MNYKFFVDRMEVIVGEVFSSIKSICPNYQHLLWFWHVKNAEIEKNWGEMDEIKESYDRQDNYNVFGLAVYLFFNNK